MQEPKSPCAKPECIGKNKLLCADQCQELAAYQEYLLKTHDPSAAQEADPTEEIEITAESPEIEFVLDNVEIE